MKKDRVAGHLMKEKRGEFPKIAFFLRADISNMAAVKINGKAVNKGKGKGKEVSWTITCTSSKQMLRKLKEVL